METIEQRSTYEIERGKPMPSDNHSLVQLNLSLLLAHFRSQFSIRPELNLELNGQRYVPDLCVLPKRTTDYHHDTIRITDVPLLTVEILSPTQSVDDLVEKAKTYFDAGVQSCWVVLPVVQSIYVLEAGKPPRMYTEGTLADPATGIEVTLEDVFRKD